MTSIMYPRQERVRMFGEWREYLLFRLYGLPRATAQDMKSNMTTAIIYWGPPGVFALDLSYRVVAMISVGLGLTGPASWPALFGPDAEAYTVRRFWRNYWHQSFRWSMTNVAAYISRHLLRFRRPSLAARYLRIIIEFTLSASLHAIIDAYIGPSPHQSGSWCFFLLQPLGIMLEEAVQALYRRYKLGAGHPWWAKVLEDRLTKVVGYLWVITFFTLTGPLYKIPIFRYQNPVKTGLLLSLQWFACAYQEYQGG
ncbi:membrane bound O-acyl transferase family-domain-containing protein [Aspergillus keveii]|uniref:Membrane bound O-acyl transferase family-domain-containing protein n=1 Tax=Aspergillus keveii TaxID=714993 RepID=A0ABR4FIG8_9EURO